jgi:DNA-directed RNA polymerase subunit RPC12/RpoP
MRALSTKGSSGPANEIVETDIIFECPHCAKSMAIDQRGGGLMISCPDCGSRIQVPHPEEGWSAAEEKPLDELLIAEIAAAIGLKGDEPDPIAGELERIQSSIQRLQQLAKANSPH